MADLLKTWLRRAAAGLPRGWVSRWRQWSAFAGTGWRFAPFVRRRVKTLGLILALGVAYTAIGLLEPWFLKLIFDTVLLGQPLPGLLSAPLKPLAGRPLALLNVIAAGLIAAAVVRGILYYYQRLLTSRLGQEVAADIRLELYSHLQRLSFGFHERRRTGDMIARLTTDIRVLRDIFISLPLSVASELFLIVGMIAVMLAVDWQLTLASLAVLPLLGVLLRRYQRPMKHAARRQREREGHIASMAAESLGAFKVVQGFRRERHEIERFKAQNKSSLRSGLRAARLEARLRWSAEVAVTVVLAVVLVLATRRVLAGALSPGDLLVFIAYLRAFNRPLRRVSSMAERAARGGAAGERVLEMLALQPAVADRPGAMRAPHLRGDVRFEGVSFGHRRGTAVLNDLSFAIAPGECVAIVGPTGAGKSSLVSLIPRFYDATAGRVTIDGHDVRDLTLASLRSQISFVFQEPVLFSTTIAENIAYGKPDASRDEIVQSARMAGIHDVIAGLPDGYDTILGERGGTISGGQRQCVAIARALIMNAPIVVLDEPTTGLDAQSASMVIEALRRLMQGRTVIMISHHLLGVRDASRILVLEEGRIVDSGTREDLLRREGLYRSFETLQVERTAG